MTEALCVSQAPRGIRLEKCEHSSHRQYSTDRVTADVQKVLSGQFGERTASACAGMWQCVKAGCRNANKLAAAWHSHTNKAQVNSLKIRSDGLFVSRSLTHI